MNIVEQLGDLLLELGAAWVLWLLLFLTVSMLAVVIERIIFFRKRAASIDTLLKRVDASLEAGDWNAALDEVRGHQSTAARVAEAGLRVAHRGAAATEKAMDGAILLERDQLENRLVYLGTLGNNAPFIGLFGTVIGVMMAFAELAQVDPAAGGMAAGSVMGAISEALVATAVGIGVALPAVAFHNWLQRRVNRIVDQAEAMTKLIAAYIVSDKPAPIGTNEEPYATEEDPAQEARSDLAMSPGE